VPPLVDAGGRAGALVPLRVPRELVPQEPPEVVLVLRFSALGDVLLTAPALEALRTAWPQSRIVYAVKQRLVDLVAHRPEVDEVAALGEGEGVFSFARRLRERLAPARSVAILDLHGKIRSVLLRALLPRRWRRVVWTKRDYRDTLPVKLALRPWRSEVLFCDRYHAAVEELVGRRLPRGRLSAALGPDDARRAAEVLRAAGGDPSRPLVGLSPGANWSTKRWPAERFGELARLCLAAGYQVAVQGSGQERELVQQIARAAPGVLDLSGRLDVAALGGFVSLCQAFVANDSGPMHLSRALGVPTLALFGSTDPGMFAWEGHRVLFRGLACSPCSFYGRRFCPRGHLRCLRELEASEAFAALQELLRGGRRALLGA
jgi:lipopolysaccharide heptosyltransferase II